MTDRTIARLLRATMIIGAALGVIGSAMFIADGHAELWWSEFLAFITLFSVFFAGFVWLVIPHQPRNAVVWAMAAIGFFGGLYVTGWAAVALLVVDDPDSVLGASAIPADLSLPASWTLMLIEGGVTLAIFTLMTFCLLLFPDGRLPSPRWRWVAVLSGIGVVVGAVGTGWSYRRGGTAVDGGLLSDVGSTAVLFASILSLAALAGRFRRSRGATRQQFKWVVWGASIFLPALIASMTFGNTSYEDFVFPLLMPAATIFVVSYGIAVGKYRLYDVDIVISRTVAYLSLAILIAALYGTAVLGLIFLFGDPNQQGGNLGLVLPATVLVAIVFEPLRVRLQRWANRLVYGERAAPHEVLSQLTSRLSDTSAAKGLVGLAQLLRDGTGAESALVWLRVGERLRMEAASPADARPDTSDLGSAKDLPASELELSVPVHHGDELLGALVITKGRSHPVNPADESLLADVAAGAGLLLRNLRLNAELAGRAVELRASRRRLIAAQDAARRRLERDLHDGAQQQVVALKVRLGLAQTIAEREGAHEVALRVADLAVGTQQAVDEMRIVARGIYPPLLEAEGLVPALGAAHRSVDLPLQLDLGTLPRYSKEVEETVYFCVLAAVDQAKMAGANLVRIDLQGDDASLTATVSYDSADRGDLTALTDRLDAFGGTVSTTTTDGTTLALELPVAGPVLEPA